MELIFIAILIGLIPAAIAKSKGRSFIGFWIYGALLFIVALPHALLMKTDAKFLEANALSNGGRKCPHCAEVVKAEAKVCRFCHRDLPSLDLAGKDQHLMKYSNMHNCESCGVNLISLDKRQCPDCVKRYGVIVD